MDEEIKALQEEMRKMHEELRQSQFRLQLLYNRLQQLQVKKGVVASMPSSAEKVSLENFIGLRLIHVVGIIVLVIGISIGVKYAIDRELITEGARISLAYAAGALLYFLSWRLRIKYNAFSAILFSGAMASLYFTTFAAYVYYGFFSFVLAFVFMIGLTLFTTYQALRYNRQEIALLGLVGAYGIPFLISSNTGNPVLLFSYIAIINTAVIFLSFKRTWRTVMHVAQVTSWLLFFGWIMTRFNASEHSAAIFFAALFYLLFITQSLLDKIFRKKPLNTLQAQQILINNLVFYIALQVIFTVGTAKDMLPAISLFAFLLVAAEAAAAFYFFSDQTNLGKMLVLLSVIYLLFFIAQQWDGLPVTLLWLGVSVVLFAAGVMKKGIWLRMAAMVLMGLTLLKQVAMDSMRFNTIQKIISYISLGILLLVVSFFYQKFRGKLFAENDVKTEA